MNHFIFFHGVGIRSHFWDTIVPKLEQKSVHYSLVDLDFTSLNNAFESSIESVREIMRKHPERNFVLVGHSLGGLFAIFVAQQLGDSIHKLIIVNTGLAPKRVAMKAMQQMQINRLSKFIKKIGMRMLFSGKLPKWLTKSLFFTDDTPDYVKLNLSKHKVRENRTFLMEHFNSKKIWNSHLDRIHFSGPDNVLSVFGSKDKTTPKRAFMYLVKKLNASHNIYHGSGHNDIITADKYNDKFVKEIILFADNV
tara:strand:+ start:22 stop:774 length:753 start_codon:yes stop_codon:yes gene_type:complete